jgi:hypothetical protein
MLDSGHLASDIVIIFALYLRSFTTDENPIMRILALAIVVSAIVIAFAFRYEPVVTATPGSAPLDRRWSFDRWFGEFHPEK